MCRQNTLAVSEEDMELLRADDDGMANPPVVEDFEMDVEVTYYEQRSAEQIA